MSPRLDRERTDRRLEGAVAEAVRNTRLAIGWTQAELAARAEVSRSTVAMIESGRTNTTFGTAGAILDALRLQSEVRFTAPFLVDRRRQREPAHARCVGYARSRLERSGWHTASEVEVDGSRSHGWIDLLAYEPRTRVVQVDEIKTELHDLGQIERTLGWYEREAWAAARRLGWRPSRVVGVLLVLMTEANETRIRENRELLGHAFPIRPPGLLAWLDDPTERRPDRARGLAMIDPLSRRADWLRTTMTDGRRLAPPYVDYADFMRRVAGRRPRRSGGWAGAPLECQPG